MFCRSSPGQPAMSPQPAVSRDSHAGIKGLSDDIGQATVDSKLEQEPSKLGRHRRHVRSSSRS
jgi:hypothetical protein